MAAWAKFPSRWLMLGNGEQCPLRELSWAAHRAAGSAALMILIMLAIRLNQVNMGRDPTSAVVSRVRVTYREMLNTTRFAKATISKALMLLESLHAIVIHRSGQVSEYELPDVAVSGAWCQLPQAYLMEGGAQNQLGAFAGLQRSRRVTLNALKLYVFFLAMRAARFNYAVVAYEKIMTYTGMRRADIPNAASLLSSMDLIRTTDDLEALPEARSKRYCVNGLRRTGQ